MYNRLINNDRTYSLKRRLDQNARLLEKDERQIGALVGDMNDRFKKLEKLWEGVGDMKERLLQVVPQQGKT